MGIYKLEQQARGTQIISGTEAKNRRQVVNKFIEIVESFGYEEIILPSIEPASIYTDKAGKEILNQMYVFNDKGNPPRELCLRPEVTATIQLIAKKHFKGRKNVKLWYLEKCWRYERCQLGRYREFWQFGVEILGGKAPDDSNEAMRILNLLLNSVGVKYQFNSSVKRGLDYYVEDGFEAECASLGAQKQIAGGGRYDCGVGFAVGLDRLLLAQEKGSQLNN